MTRRKIIARVVGLTLVVAFGIGATVFVVSRHAETLQRPADRLGVSGTNVTERDLSPEEQFRLLNQFAPIPIPASATDIRIRYQRFQDIFLDASFMLPPADYDAYVQQLQPLSGHLVGVSSNAGQYQGRIVGNYTSIIIPDPATHRIAISYVAG